MLYFCSTKSCKQNVRSSFLSERQVASMKKIGSNNNENKVPMHVGEGDVYDLITQRISIHQFYIYIKFNNISRIPLALLSGTCKFSRTKSISTALS